LSFSAAREAAAEQQAIENKDTQGLKPVVFLSATYGTTEVVP
jgi:hypothetical protein